MDLLEVVRLVREHAWLPLAALVIGFLVRLLKSDVPFVFDVPAKYRPLAAVILGLAAAGVDRVISGTPAREALTEGLSAAALAIAGHVLGIEWLRDGKEITVGANKPKGPPPNIPSTIPVSLMLVLAIGCGPTLGPNEQAEILEHGLLVNGCKAEAKQAASKLDAGRVEAGLAFFDSCVDGGR